MNSVTYTILTLLKKTSGHLSGTHIGKDLHISRSAVWKHISLLRDRGYDIESVPRRGTFCAPAPMLPGRRRSLPC